MSHTHTSPSARSARMRRRVASASALYADSNVATSTLDAGMNMCLDEYITERLYSRWRIQGVPVADITHIVRQTYAAAAGRARSGRSAACGCGSSQCCGPDPITSNLYDAAETQGLPAEAVLASLGCGNPTA